MTAIRRASPSYVCYDDVDPDAYQQGAIAFHANGLRRALAALPGEAIAVVDRRAHTSGPDVRQSPIDVRHPMLPILGHTAMIVPNFAKTAWWSLKAVGVYEYLGGFKWRTHSASAPSRRVKLSLW